MAKHRYITGVLFEDDMSDTEDCSPNGFRHRIGPMPKKSNNGNGIQQQNQLTVQKIQEIEKRTLESAKRSINLLHETGEIAIRAAEELACQGDKLENANTRLDEIDAHLKKSQKDINGIKSVFYGFKNILSGKSRSPSPSKRHMSPSKKSPKLGRSKFYSNIDQSSIPGTTKLGDYETPSTSLHSLNIQSSVPHTSKQVDDMLDANLDVIAQQIAQYKIFSLEFGKEIDHQNEIIDILQDKVDRADTKIGKQNKDMNKILGK